MIRWFLSFFVYVATVLVSVFAAPFPGVKWWKWFVNIWSTLCVESAMTRRYAGSNPAFSAR